MSPPNQDILKVGDVGPFEVLSRKPNPDGLTLQYVPGIDALLVRAEQLKGALLSDREIGRIKASASVMAVTETMAKTVKDGRGYD